MVKILTGELNSLGGDKITAIIRKTEHSASYYLRCIRMERMENLYKTLKNTDNPHGLYYETAIKAENSGTYNMTCFSRQ